MTITASPTLKISEKQAKWIKDLAAEKTNWLDVVDGPTSKTIKTVIRATDYVAIPSDISRANGSKAIDALLKINKITPKLLNATKNTFNAKTQAQEIISALPASAKGIKYAIKNTDPKSPNEYVFYEIVERKSGKFINRLQGAPGTWHRIFVKYTDYAGIADRILEVGPKTAAHKYSELYTRCSCCDAPLSNGKSIEQAMGPICAKKFK